MSKYQSRWNYVARVSLALVFYYTYKVQYQLVLVLGNKKEKVAGIA